jgi:hypothetical protein
VTAASGSQSANSPTCSVTPSTLTLDANGNGTVQVSVATSGPTSTGSLTPFGGTHGDRAPLYASLLSLPALGLVFLGLGLIADGSRKRSFAVASFLFVSWLAAAAGCGPTVQRSNLGCTTCTTPATYTITVTASSQNPVLQASGVFTVTVGP